MAQPCRLGIKIPIASSSALASGDQISGGLSVATTTFSRPRNELIDVELPSSTDIKRSFASVYFSAEPAKLFHMGKQLLTDGLLIGFRQRRDFVHSFFHEFCHTRHHNLTFRASRNCII